MRVPIFKGESKAEVKERIYRKNAGKHETKIRNMDDNWNRKLSRGEKEAMRMEVEKERREAGNPVKSSYGKTHSKLDQHSEIQKMADEHVRKIWTKEGGVANKELYDEADKFAEKNNLDKKKVRDAAFKAMNEKYADSLKLKKEGKDPLQNIKKESKQSKQINDDFDTKEKQIKQNEAERNKLNAKYADEEHHPTAMGDVKKGDFFKLSNKPNAKVYVRDYYDKSEKAYWCYEYYDVNSGRYMKKNKTVYTGFTF